MKILPENKLNIVLLLSLILAVLLAALYLYGTNGYIKKTSFPQINVSQPSPVIKVCPSNNFENCDYYGGTGFQQAIMGSPSGSVINLVKGEYHSGDKYYLSNKDTELRKVWVSIEDKEITINGNNSTITAKNSSQSMYGFALYGSSQVRINNLTISEFYQDVPFSKVDTTKPYSKGICLAAFNNSILTINNSKIIDCGVRGVQAENDSNVYINGSLITGSGKKEMELVQKPENSGVWGYNASGVNAYDDSKVYINNSIVSKNYIGNIYLSENSSINITNSVIAEPIYGQSTTNATNILVWHSARLEVENSILYEPNPRSLEQVYRNGGHRDTPSYAPNVNNSIIYGAVKPFFGYVNFNNLIEQDAQFVNYPTDLHLKPTSPGINSGNTNIKDLDGSRSDIGIYGGPNPYILDLQDFTSIIPNTTWQGPIPSLTMPDGTAGKPSAQAEVYLGQIPNTNQGVVLQTVVMQSNNKSYNRFFKVDLSNRDVVDNGTFSAPIDLFAYKLPSSVPTNATINAYGLTFVPPNKLLSTIFVNGVGYSKYSNYNISSDGSVGISSIQGEGWQQVSLNNVPGTGTIQAYDYSYYNHNQGFYLETVVRNNNLYYRYIRSNSDSGTKSREQTTNWKQPILGSSIPGTGDILTYSYYVINDREYLNQALWKTSGGYFRELATTGLKYDQGNDISAPTPTPRVPTPTPTPTPSIPTPNKPPVINSISFSSNNNYVDPSDVTVSVSASDPDGTVSSVEFYHYDSLLHTDNTPPFTYTWSGRVQGGHLIKVRAKDNNGTYSSYSTKGFTVNSTLTPTPNIISLDVNNDKKQDILDVITAIKVVFNNQPSSNSVDVNGDGKKDILDVIKIIQAVFSGSPS